MKYILPVVFLCFVFLFTSSVYAVTLTASNIPPVVDQSAEFEVTVDLSCKSCDASYLRGVFYPSGTSYFGFTQNKEGNWINAPGGTCLSYYPVIQSELSQEGTWSGKIRVKPDTSSPLFNGPGEYVFKVIRYTPSCSGTTQSQETTIAITGPAHTPTSTQTPVPTNSPIPTHTPAPTHTPIPTKTVTQAATSSPVVTVSVSILPTISQEVLGETIQSTRSSIFTSFTAMKPIIISLTLVAIGCAVLTFALVFQIHIKRQQKEKGNDIIEP